MDPTYLDDRLVVVVGPAESYAVRDGAGHGLGAVEFAHRIGDEETAHAVRTLRTWTAVAGGTLFVGGLVGAALVPVAARQDATSLLVAFPVGAAAVVGGTF